MSRVSSSVVPKPQVRIVRKSHDLPILFDLCRSVHAGEAYRNTVLIQLRFSATSITACHDLPFRGRPIGSYLRLSCCSQLLNRLSVQSRNDAMSARTELPNLDKWSGIVSSRSGVYFAQQHVTEVGASYRPGDRHGSQNNRMGSVRKP